MNTQSIVEKLCKYKAFFCALSIFAKRSYRCFWLELHACFTGDLTTTFLTNFWSFSLMSKTHPLFQIVITLFKITLHYFILHTQLFHIPLLPYNKFIDGEIHGGNRANDLPLVHLPMNNLTNDITLVTLWNAKCILTGLLCRIIHHEGNLIKIDTTFCAVVF